MLDLKRLHSVVETIDTLNSKDPDGKEFIYGQRMTRWLFKLKPDADELLQIAARGQHIRRWEVPRDQYPKTRSGYLAWRTRLYKFHGDCLAEIMQNEGYLQADIDRVREILSKKNLKLNPDAQWIEDVACLVFLEFYLPEFVLAQPKEKLIPIIQKTWAKMSEQAHAEALKINYAPEHGCLIQEALGK